MTKDTVWKGVTVLHTHIPDCDTDSISIFDTCYIVDRYVRSNIPADHVLTALTHVNTKWYNIDNDLKFIFYFHFS